MVTKPTGHKTLPFAGWPEIDQRLWASVQDSDYAATLHPFRATLARRGYGRWLSVLAAQGCLDVAQHPADRVTLAAVRAYLDRLHEAGNMQSTINGYLGDLARALRIMVPERSFTWLGLKRLQRVAHPEYHPRKVKDCLEDWPGIDRQLWQAAFQPGDILEGPHYAAGLRPATIRMAKANYNHWLVFLCATGRLELLANPAARVTRQAVVAYVQYLQRTNCNSSLIKRVSALRRALRILQPEADLRWLTAPGGQSLTSLLPVTKRPMQVIGSKILYEWGHALMRDALADPDPELRRTGYRDGLLIALFAARGPRVGSMVSLCLGKTVTRIGGTYRLVFEHDDVKTRRHIEYDAPAGLSAALDRYIAVERVELLGTQSQQALWLNRFGEPQTIESISNMVRCRSELRFGKAFGPHRFRHGIGTMAPLLDPAHPGVAAAMLGISDRVVERHYNRASQADVANKLHATLRKQRSSMQTLARQAYLRNG